MAPLLRDDGAARIRVEAISRALVDLKLQEVAATRGSSVDTDKVALLRSQQAALEQEITKIEIAALQSEERRLKERYLPEHPRMRAIRAEIEALNNKMKSHS